MIMRWLKLHRELKDKPIWKMSTPEQKAVLITLLMMTNYEPKSWEWMGKKFTVQPGQMVTSLESIVLECGKGVSIQQTRTALTRFEKLGFLTNESTKTGRLITINNWDTYQAYDAKGNKEDNSQITVDQQSDNKQANTFFREEEIREKKKNIVEIDPIDLAAKEVLAYLNQLTGKRFTTYGKIKERLNAGATVADCKRVLDNKNADPKFSKQYLDHTTPFRPANFDRYLNERPEDRMPVISQAPADIYAQRRAQYARELMEDFDGTHRQDVQGNDPALPAQTGRPCGGAATPGDVGEYPF
jgi:uncharacterized phage protein (TIGR02220 family)